MIHSGQRKGINMRYKTVYDFSPVDLDTKVEKHLVNGWELYGNQYCKETIPERNGKVFYQPMIWNDK